MEIGEEYRITCEEVGEDIANMSYNPYGRIYEMVLEKRERNFLFSNYGKF